MTRPKSLLLVWLISCFLSGSVITVITGADTFPEECNDDFQKVMTCLDFATGKAPTPSKDCCSSIDDIKKDNPKCLCLIMQKSHSGAQTMKSLGIQEAKLLQLPSACQIKNASITDCPNLLGLSPNSPDAAIFTNASSKATPATTGTPTSTEKADGSGGSMHGPHIFDPKILLLAVSIFFFAFPAGSAAAWC